MAIVTTIDRHALAAAIAMLLAEPASAAPSMARHAAREF